MLLKKIYLKTSCYFLTIALVSACIINDNIKDTSTFIDPGNDPNFTIIANNNTGFELFNRKVLVFEIPIYAFKEVEDNKLLHTANVLAQFLDNDEDGLIDNLGVYNNIIANKSFLFLWKLIEERDSFTSPNGFFGNDISADAVKPIWHTNGHVDSFDFALENVWFLITKTGYEKNYPTVFSAQTNSEISEAMDVARGGNFINPPATYPVGAWYTSSNVSCNYTCQISKYNYWILITKLGAQENRLSEIEDEWKLNTSTKLQTIDVKAWTIFSNVSYKLPTNLPDGTYKH